MWSFHTTQKPLSCRAICSPVGGHDPSDRRGRDHGHDCGYDRHYDAVDRYVCGLGWNVWKCDRDCDHDHVLVRRLGPLLVYLPACDYLPVSRRVSDRVHYHVRVTLHVCDRVRVHVRIQIHFYDHARDDGRDDDGRAPRVVCHHAHGHVWDRGHLHFRHGYVHHGCGHENVRGRDQCPEMPLEDVSISAPALAA